MIWVAAWCAQSGGSLQSVHPQNPKSKIQNGITFSPDGKTLLSSSNDRTVRLWDLETGQLLHLLLGHRERVKCVGMSPDGQMLLSCSADSQVRAWDLDRAEERPIYAIGNAHLSQVLSLAISDRHQILVSGGADLEIKLWKVSS